MSVPLFPLLSPWLLSPFPLSFSSNFQSNLFSVTRPPTSYFFPLPSFSLRPILASLFLHNAKSVFLAVNASLPWLNNGVYLVQVSLLLIGPQDLGHFFRCRPLLLIGWRIVQILRQRRKKTTSTAPPTF
jgi:hypothetical protein